MNEQKEIIHFKSPCWHMETFLGNILFSQHCLQAKSLLCITAINSIETNPQTILLPFSIRHLTRIVFKTQTEHDQSKNYWVF